MQGDERGTGPLKLPAVKVLWAQQLRSLAWECDCPSAVNGQTGKFPQQQVPKFTAMHGRKYFTSSKSQNGGPKNTSGVWLQKIPGWARYDCYMQNY